MKRFATWATAIVSALAVAGGCSSSESDAESGGQAATADLEACKIFLVSESKFVDLKSFIDDAQHPERKNDPVLNLIMAGVRNGKTCPKTFAEMQKVDEVSKCQLQTRVVSERSFQLGNAPEVGRALASRSCNGQPSLFFLLDPVDTRKNDIPEDVEVLGNNATDGIFTYYAREEGEGGKVWKYYGTSKDFVTNGYECGDKFNGACQSKFAQDEGIPGHKGSRCASCHPGGGMVQKELNSPWSNWMNDQGGYIAKHSKELGSFQDGDLFEGTTTNLNANWAKKRVELLKKDPKELLRPVFCTMDINVQSGGLSARADLMIDLAFASNSFFGNPDAFGGIGSTRIASLDANAYTAAIAGQTIQGLDGKGFKDTPDAFMYPERSNLNHQYVAALASVVGEELIKDILFVDFTRPIFSKQRCSLVDLAGGIDLSNAKQAILGKIPGSGRSAAQEAFFQSLSSTTAAHQAAVDGYVKACQTQSTTDAATFTKDVVKYASHLRRVSRLVNVKIATEDDALGIIDFPETFPSDGLVQNDPHFNPTTCKLE